MFNSQLFLNMIIEHWPVWVVTVTLVVAAVIDGLQLKVPNWITYPMIVGGWAYSTWFFGAEGLMWSVIGMFCGLALLMPLYAIGGMGAGDVKLMGGIGAWLWGTVTLWAFAYTAVIGGVLALGMIFYRRDWNKHSKQMVMIVNEVATVRNPETLATIAAQRKPQMYLLPYGIPIAIGSIAYFAVAGMLP
jgi:prepilin peptidase CpaA